MKSRKSFSGGFPRHVLAAVGAALIAGAAAAQAASVVAYWDFEKVEADGVSVKAKMGTYTGTLTDAAILADNGGGRPGKGLDVSVANKGYMLLEATGDDNPMNKAAVDDQVTVVVWQKNNANINSSTFWAVADSQARGWQFHVPWSDGTIYFDTVGCCAANQRLSQNVEAKIPGFDWTAWHHYAFVKDKDYKAIYVDGQLLLDGTGFDPLTPDFNALYIGAASDKGSPDGIIDDFAIYKGALTPTEIQQLAGGASPGGGIKDADADGMPDDWETQYAACCGLNPNDAKDAALDCNSNGRTNLDEYKAGTNPCDNTKPTIVSAAASATFDTVTITFSKALDPVTAGAIANYSISPSLAVTAAAVKSKTVTLTTAKQTPGATAYTVTVNNVKDVNNWPVAADSKVVFYSYIMAKDGALKFSYWGGIPGGLDALYGDARYPATPDMVGGVFSFNSRDIFPDDTHENYGASMEGYLTPTESGSYRFFIYSDDASQLFLSTDDKEANLLQIAEETGCCNYFTEPDSPRTSEPIALVAGKKYFIRLVYKEGGGGDYGQVAWRKEGDKTPAGSLLPIPGKYLSSAVDLPAPPDGGFTLNPVATANNVSPIAPIRIVHRDGKTPWAADKVSMKLNGAAVTPTFTKDGLMATIEYLPPALYPSKSVQTVALTYPDPSGAPTTLEYSFTVTTYSGPAKDKVASYPALIMGSAVYTADAGGASGKAGDYGMDLTVKGGPVQVIDSKFMQALNAATAGDELSVSMWIKKYDIADSSAFYFTSPTQARVYQAHVPWSNSRVYFDTAGCCDATTQRIDEDIAIFPGYSGDATWWNSWHLFVFTKKADQKNVYIDGSLFLNGSSSGLLSTDINQLNIGADNSTTGGKMHAVVDDFAVYGKELTAANITALKSGTKPSDLTGTGLIGWWDFNDATAAAPPTITVGVIAGKPSITYTGTLQSSATVNGAYTDVTGATSPYTVDTAKAAQSYYRARQ
jgi:hypothetical protein